MAEIDCLCIMLCRPPDSAIDLIGWSAIGWSLAIVPCGNQRLVTRTSPLNAHSPWLLSGRSHVEEYRTWWGCTRLPSLYKLMLPPEMVFIYFVHL